MHKVTASVKYGARARYDEQSEWQRRANGWTVKLRYQGRTMTVDYWTGVGITDDPTARDVLETLCWDALSADQSFEDWCADFGDDTDSRTAERIYHQVREQTAKLRRLLGDDYDKIVFMDESEFKSVTA